MIETTPYVQKLLPIAEALGQTVFKMASELDMRVSEHKLLEPRFLAGALLCRTLSNFRGAVRLVQSGLVVEARVLTRCCFENIFMIGGLRNEGIAFAKKIKADDQAGRRSRRRYMTDNEEMFEGLSDETKQALAKADELLQAGAKGAFLKFKDASERGPFKQMYLAYSQYSSDAAHPTFTALMRHFEMGGDETIFDVVPESPPHQLDETLHLACLALLGAAVAVDEIHGGTNAAKQLPAISDQLVTLQNEKFGDQKSETSKSE